MLRLRTFGGLALERGYEPLAGAAPERRRLSILAVFAVAGVAECDVELSGIAALA